MLKLLPRTMTCTNRLDNMQGTNHQFAQLAESLVAEAFVKFPLARPVVVQWRQYRTTAGMADYRDNAILLSRSLMTDEDRLKDTVLHEYAHLLAFHRAGRAGRGHGAAWRQAMADLGQSPSVRHTYSCTRNTQRQFVHYECATCGTRIVRNRRLPKRRIYLHAGCGGRIRFVGLETRTS